MKDEVEYQEPTENPKVVSKRIRRVQEEMDRTVGCLRESHPEFFRDPDARDLAAVILAEMGDYVGGMSPVKMAGLVASVQTLMYLMGAAAIRSVRGGKRMTRRMVDDYVRNNKEACEEMRREASRD